MVYKPTYNWGGTIKVQGLQPTPSWSVRKAKKLVAMTEIWYVYNVYPPVSSNMASWKVPYKKWA
jgi:hypothetical protein